MVLNFNYPLPEAIKRINHLQYHYFPLHELEEMADHSIIAEPYGKIKWKIVDLLNEHPPVKEHLQKINRNPFDLHHWLYYDEADEVAYFLNETGSNSLNYSPFKAPSAFHLWIGEKGFIIGIEQKGHGFYAENINRNRIKENEGAAFDFYRRCRSKIFFDHPQNTTIVFMEYLY